MSSIIVATDLSKKSVEIVKQASILANDLGANLHLVHVIKEVAFSIFNNQNDFKEEVFSILKDLFPKIEDKFLHVEVGRVDEVVSNLAKKIEAKLVILGNCGEGDELKSPFVGRDTKALVRKLITPALIVKNIGSINVEKILIPTDFSEQSKWHIKAISLLFPKAKIILTHIYNLKNISNLNLYKIDSQKLNELKEDELKRVKTVADFFLKSLDSKVDLALEEGKLTASTISKIALKNGAKTVAIHTTEGISLFAFDLLLETDNNLLISAI